MNAPDPYAAFFGIAASERPKLSEPENTALLAKLKAVDPARFEALIAALKANKVPRLRELEQDVKRLVKEAEKNKTARLAQHRGESDDSDGFKRNEAGKILSTQVNIRLAIDKMGVDLRYNTFACLPCIYGLKGFGPAIDDNAMNRLWLAVEARFGFRPPKDYFITVVSDQCQQNPFHPVCDYLDGLKWDGVERLDSWLTTYCGAEDSNYTRAVGALVLIAAVRRVRKPGEKFDEMLTLESPEGFNKSTLLRVLAVRDEWFSDSLQLNVSDKQVIEGAGGKWIIEYAELQGMRKGDVGKIKAQLSRTHDRARLAYARLPTENPRQCVFFGTVNPAVADGYLASLTGNRRFWPIEVKRIDLDAFRRDRNQLWAEAAAREAEGASIRLDQSLWDVAALHQRAREAPNEVRDALAPHLSDCEGVIFSSDVWTLLNVSLTQRQMLYGKLGKAMADLGWTKKQIRWPGIGKVEAYSRGDETYRIAVDRDRDGLSIGRINRADADKRLGQVIEDLTEDWHSDDG